MRGEGVLLTNSKQYKAPKRKRRTSEELVRDFSQAYIKTKGNATKAYLLTHPGVKYKTAQSNAVKIVHRPDTQYGIKQAMLAQGLGEYETMGMLKQAIQAGLTKKATNRDAIAGLKLLIDAHTGVEKADLMALQRQELEALNDEILNERIQQMKQSIAIDAELV